MKKVISPALPFLTIVFFFCFHLSTQAQSAMSLLRGTVYDSSGAAIVHARIVCRNLATNAERETFSDDQGSYQFSQIAAGNYQLTALATGFAPLERSITLLVGQAATLQLSMRIATLESVAEVSDRAARINQNDATVGDAVAQESIASLPMEGRNVSELLSLQPGVLFLGSDNNQQYDSRTGASTGGRSDQSNLMLDGISNNDEVRGLAFTGVLRATLDSVEEFRVTTSGIGADGGRGSGAQISLLTRSGSNNFHGSLYEYNRSSIGEANDWFNKQAELLEGLENQPGKLIRNTFGVTFSGPIKHDRLFIFANYEGQRTAENVQQTMTVPTATMRAGELRYPHTSNGTTSTITLSSSEIAAMDPNCASNGTCPLGAGANPAVMAVFAQYPKANGSTAGDGLNTASYTWSAPNPAHLNTSMARVDWTITQHQQLFVRGNLQEDHSSSVPQFSGDLASSQNTDNSRGIAAVHIWAPNSSLANTARFGFTRQGYSQRGIGSGQYANFYNMSSLEAETRTALVTVPVIDLLDDLSWQHHRHTIQAGASFRSIWNRRNSDALSYSYGYTNAYSLMDAGITGTGQSLDPDAFGHETVDSSFANSYSFAAGNLAGLLDLVTTQANYRIAQNGNSATLLDAGTMLARDFHNKEFEWYIADTWHPTSNLTFSVGVRHMLQQTPYETHGQQAQPTVDVDAWFRTRAADAKAGSSTQPDLYFSPSGQARNKKGYWPMPKLDFSPRVALAWSPNFEQKILHTIFGSQGSSSLRAGWGIYFDHFGEGIVNTFDQYGSFGLSQSITNPTNLLTPDDSPRFSGMHELPNITGTPSSAITYPSLAPNDPLWTGFAITHGLDDHMKTPYAESIDLSFQRALPAGFVIESNYIARLGRHQLEQIDMAQPLNLVDAASGSDYFTAATAMTKAKNEGRTSIDSIKYFEDMFPDAASGSTTATQNIFDIWLPGNETGALYMLDILCTPGCGGATNRYWPRQFASLYTWSSMGTSNYQAGELILSRSMSHDAQIRLSYTFSKSLDMGSDAERTMYSSSTGTSAGSSFGAILNAWNPRQNYGPSDYDVRHLIAGSWNADLPVGAGKTFFASASRRINAIVGGWRSAGVVRWTSGLPFSVVSGTGWSTNWDEHSSMVRTGTVRTRTHINSSGEPEVFDNATTALANMRDPYPGEAGERNNFRGDGYFDLDASLSKNWKMEHGSIRFAWESFNVTNTVRFDVNPLNSLQNMTTSGEFGVYGALLTKPRLQQFSLRYSF